MAADWARSYCSALGLDAGSRVELASAEVVKLACTRVVAWVTTIPPQTDKAYTVAACSEPSLMQLVAVALVKAALMVGCSLDAPTVLAAHSMGTVEIKLLEQDELLSSLPVTDDSWLAWLKGMHDSHAQLKAALLAIPDDHD